jgi:excisionase family DNA binding protein
MTNPSELLTRAEVAKLLRVSKRTLSNWCLRGDIPVIRITKRFVRFRRSDVEEFIEKGKK